MYGNIDMGIQNLKNNILVSILQTFHLQEGPNNSNMFMPKTLLLIGLKVQTFSSS